MTLFPQMTPTTKGLIATASLLGLISFGLIAYLTLNYLKNRPPKLLDHNMKVNF